MFVCLLSIEIQTAEWIGKKFGTEVVLDGGKVPGGMFDPVPPPPGTGCIKGVLGASRASAMCFGKNFIKQKLQGPPNLVVAGHRFGPQIRIWKDLGPGPMSFWWSLTMKGSSKNQSCSICP